MSKWVIQELDPDSYEVIDESFDGEIYDSKEDAENELEIIKSSMPAGREIFELRGEYERIRDYGILEVEEIDD